MFKNFVRWINHSTAWAQDEPPEQEIYSGCIVQLKIREREFIGCVSHIESGSASLFLGRNESGDYEVTTVPISWLRRNQHSLKFSKAVKSAVGLWG